MKKIMKQTNEDSFNIMVDIGSQQEQRREQEGIYNPTASEKLNPKPLAKGEQSTFDPERDCKVKVLQKSRMGGRCKYELVGLEVYMRRLQEETGE
jgi:hypothetical protein